MNYVIINIILNSILLGIILLTQFVSYPLFKKVNADFENYHSDYTNRMGFVVGPIMMLELIFVILLLTNHNFDNNIIVITISTLLIWVSTFFIQVPIHKKIAYKKDLRKIKKLISTNLIRTFLWTVKLFFSVLII